MTAGRPGEIGPFNERHLPLSPAGFLKAEFLPTEPASGWLGGATGWLALIRFRHSASEKVKEPFSGAGKSRSAEDQGHLRQVTNEDRCPVSGATLGLSLIHI